MNKIYGFEGEVKSKFNETMVELFAEVFCCLPLVHVLNGKVFVVHGGLFSTDGVKLSDIRSIDRFVEPPDEGSLYVHALSDFFIEKVSGRLILILYFCLRTNVRAAME